MAGNGQAMQQADARRAKVCASERPPQDLPDRPPPQQLPICLPSGERVAGSKVHLHLRDPLHEGQLIAAQNTTLIDMYHDRARRWTPKSARATASGDANGVTRPLRRRRCHRACSALTDVGPSATAPSMADAPGPPNCVTIRSLRPFSQRSASAG